MAEATGGRDAIQPSPAGLGPALLVTGLVDNPGEIDLATVQRLRAQTLTLTFTSPKKPARQRTFRGVWLIDMLHLARLQVDRAHPLMDRNWMSSGWLSDPIESADGR